MWCFRAAEQLFVRPSCIARRFQWLGAFRSNLLYVGRAVKKDVLQYLFSIPNLELKHYISRWEVHNNPTVKCRTVQNAIRLRIWVQNIQISKRQIKKLRVPAYRVSTHQNAIQIFPKKRLIKKKKKKNGRENVNLLCVCLCWVGACCTL